jgi:hypothetical protein
MTATASARASAQVVEQTVEQQHRHTTATIALPAAGQATMGDLQPPRPLSPELERRRQQALIGWKHDVELLLSRCVHHPTQDHHVTPLQVFFAPRPRAASDHQQVLAPSWISLLPPDRERLWQAIPAVELDACLARAQTVGITVALTDDALSHAFPASAENVLVEL